MLKNILDVKNVQILSKKEQRKVNGGTGSGTTGQIVVLATQPEDDRVCMAPPEICKRHSNS